MIVRAVIPVARDTIKQRAHRVGARAILYDNGHVRIRSAQGVQDFVTRKQAEDHLSGLKKQRRKTRT